MIMANRCFLEQKTKRVLVFVFFVGNKPLRNAIGSKLGFISTYERLLAINLVFSIQDK